MKCPYCGNPRATGDIDHTICKKCGIDEYKNIKKAYLEKQVVIQQNFIEKAADTALNILYTVLMWAARSIHHYQEMRRRGL